MAKLLKAGSGFVKYGVSLINLKGFKEIQKEDEQETSMIFFTPFMPSKEDWENGVEGSWAITYVNSDERDEDFQLIEELLKQE